MRNATQRSFLFVFTLVLGLAVQNDRAEAKCAGPQDNWSLSEGEAIPAKATMYYFVPSWHGDKEIPKVRANGAALRSEWKQVSKNEGFTSYRLTFDAGDASKVVVTKGAQSRTYPVRKWTAPDEGRLSGTLGTRLQDQWTCSHTDILPATVNSRARAFRVAWSDRRNGIHDFGSGTSIFPKEAGNFWRYGDEKENTHASFELGHPNCFANNVPSENLEFLLASVTPLFRDGSEGRPVVLERSSTPDTLGEGESEAPVAEEAPGVAPPVAVPAEEVVPLPALHLQGATESKPLVSTRLWAIALLLGALFGFLLFRSHRHGVPLARIVSTGAVVSLACGALAWAASVVCFPFWLLFAIGGLGVLYAAARYLEPDE